MSGLDMKPRCRERVDMASGARSIPVAHHQNQKEGR